VSEGPAPEAGAAPAAAVSAPAAGLATGPVIGTGTWVVGLIVAAVVVLALIAG